jgi:predicted amidohydrolase
VTLRVGLLQLQSGDRPDQNLKTTIELIEKAVSEGAEFVATPEVTNIVSTSRAHQQSVLETEQNDPSLAALRRAAEKEGVWLSIGSLALKSGDPDEKFVNRSFLISPKGEVAAKYDKIHMFDVTVSATESYQESKAYRAGSSLSLTATPIGAIGLTICYDVRFPELYEELARNGAQIILAPSAFSPTTGAAHWEALLRARAIENGCFIIASAQWGDHSIEQGKPRQTYGHSLVVDPWGEVVAEKPEGVGVLMADIALEKVAQARAKIPNLTHRRVYEVSNGR